MRRGPLKIGPKKIEGKMEFGAKKIEFRAKKIDVISRVLFPGTFTVFNIMYWSYYLTQEQQSSDKK